MLLTVCTVAIALLLSGCGLGDDATTGTLVLSFAEKLTAKTIEPTLDMEVHHYEVLGTGPGGATFQNTVELPENTVVRSSLLPGEWTIEAWAYNDDGPPATLIGYGTTTVQIIAGYVLNDATVTVIPLIGTGTLTLEISWPIGVLTNPVLEGTLVPAGDTYNPQTDDLDFGYWDDGDVSTDAESHSGTWDNGYYTLTLRLLDLEDDLVWGTAEAVRIVKDEDSWKRYVLVEDVNREHLGRLELEIIEQMDNPFTIDFDVADNSTYFEGDPVVVEATAEDGVAVDTWSWYLQGVPQADGDPGVTIVSGSTTSTITLSGLPYAFYWLDVVGTSGNVLSSATLEFQVEEGDAPPPPPPQETLLDYDMSLTPDEQGFALSNSCGTEWNATGSILEYRGCTEGQAAASARFDGIFTGMSTAQLDISMKILDSDGYAFELVLTNGASGRYTKIRATDFGDSEYHDVTLFLDFENNYWVTYLDGALYDFYDFSWTSSSHTFIMGDGNSSGTWGNVDIQSLLITGNLIDW